MTEEKKQDKAEKGGNMAGDIATLGEDKRKPRQLLYDYFDPDNYD